MPVIVAGRISQPQEAEAILAAGQADACVMTRALICDPELPAKTEAGRLDDIRACIGCNQACIGHFHAGYPISCIQFPESGREREFPRIGRPGEERHPAAARARDVLVIGGGPGGLKAAAVAAERGHRVTLVEAGPARGRPGAARAGAAGPGRDRRRDHEPAWPRPSGRASRSSPASARTPRGSGSARPMRRSSRRARSPTGRRSRSMGSPVILQTLGRHPGRGRARRPRRGRGLPLATGRASAWRRCSPAGGHRVTLAVVGHDGRAADPAVRARHDDRRARAGHASTSGRRSGCTGRTRRRCSSRTC